MYCYHVAGADEEIEFAWGRDAHQLGIDGEVHDDEGIVVGVIYLRALDFGEHIVEVERVEPVCTTQELYLFFARVYDVNPGEAIVRDGAHVETARSGGRRSRTPGPGAGVR